MTNYKALAWDDNPENAVTGLIERLKDFGISVELERETDKFNYRFHEGDWDFIMLDVIDMTDPEFPRFNAGIDLAARVREYNKWVPIVFMTSRGDIPTKEKPTTGPVLYRSKGNPRGELVSDIMDFVRANVFDRDTVFLIYGHDRKAGKLRADTIKRLESGGLKVKSITPEKSMVALSSRLIEEMSRCGGFIAICTPDDKVEGGSQPRQNVLLEIGIAMGMSRGLERLITLQRWGNDESEQATLPSDLAGSLTIRFYDENNYEDALDQLMRGLKERGLRIHEGMS